MTRAAAGSGRLRARNPKTPPALAVRALDHVPLDALRQIAKGAGALTHVTQAARKKLLG